MSLFLDRLRALDTVTIAPPPSFHHEPPPTHEPFIAQIPHPEDELLLTSVVLEKDPLSANFYLVGTRLLLSAEVIQGWLPLPTGKAEAPSWKNVISLPTF